MKILLALIFFFSTSAHAAVSTSTASTPSKRNTTLKDREKTKEPSAVPCTPQQTRDEKLDDLAKLEGPGESHSTNCPAQGTIKEAPDAPPTKTE